MNKSTYYVRYIDDATDALKVYRVTCFRGMFEAQREFLSYCQTTGINPITYKILTESEYAQVVSYEDEDYSENEEDYSEDEEYYLDVRWLDAPYHDESSPLAIKHRSPSKVTTFESIDHFLFSNDIGWNGQLVNDLEIRKNNAY